MHYLKGFILITLIFILINTKPNLFLGTGGFGYGCGSNSPAVQLPFSYVRLGPDTTPNIQKSYMRFTHFGGYSNLDHFTTGISHMHLVGAGVIDLGTLALLPIKKSSVTIPKSPQVALYKTTEYAQPGYYNVTLQNNIDIQLTTTQRVGVHRYKFNDKGTHQVYIMSSFLLLRPSNRYSWTKSCGPNCIQGDIFNNGGFGKRFGGFHIYYHLQWKSKGNKSNQSIYFYNDSNISAQATSANGNYSGAVIQTNAQEIEIYIGLSYVSIKNAKQNMDQQIRGRGFDQIKEQSLKIWKQQLSRFEIAAITPDYQTKIDTAIYRTLLSPTMFNDWNGDYLSFSLNGSILKKPNDMNGVYTDMSLWDVHRTQFPWLQFQDLQRFNDIAKSIVLMNRQGGYMPKWPFANGHTGCMIGAHANTILSDWMLKQAFKDPTVNKTQIMNFMLRNANNQTPWDGRSAIPSYISKGYLNTQQGSSSSSCPQTLQYSYNDHGIGKFAQFLNMTSVATEFKRRSKFYKNLFNNDTKFFQPKFKNGSFVEISKLERINMFSTHYVEGDAWHYRFYAPHDTLGLAELFGGKQYFIKELDKFFRLSYEWPTLWLPNPYYWAGNQHNLFSVWMFNFVNRSDLTQKHSRKILDSQYGTDGDGLPGNDDYGTMSAWLIWASLGFYPLPSENFYILGSPTIHSARIYRKMGYGKLLALNIQVNNNSAKNYLVESVHINNKNIKDFVNYEQFSTQNSVLSFLMK